MTRDPVRIQAELRQFVVDCVVKRLIERYNPVEIATLDAIHLHVLVQINNPSPKIELGAAKQFATAQLKSHELAECLNLKRGEGIWGKSSHPKPIADQAHWLRARKYIRDHAHRGAALWTFERLTSLFPADCAGAAIPRNVADAAR